MKYDEILHIVRQYYGEKIAKFGPVPAGVDWNGVESQNMRFEQLLKLFKGGEKSFSLLDYGCGYGALLQFLGGRYDDMRYTGYDISKEMIASVVEGIDSANAVWTSNSTELSKYDYVLASGLFNVKGKTSYSVWEEYVLDTLDHMDGLSVKGFTFNLLSDYADPERMKDYLFYARPEKFFHHCKTKFSKAVALLHDYPLFEFTIHVRKA